MSTRTKEQIRQRLHERIRKKLRARESRPRLAVYRSQAHIYAQVIDDDAGRTLVAASSLDKDVRAKLKSGGNVAAAKEVGGLIAEPAPRRRASRKSCSTAAASSTTAGSRPWPTQRARRG